MKANSTSLVARSQEGVWLELGLSQQQKKINGFGRQSFKPFREASASIVRYNSPSLCKHNPVENYVGHSVTSLL